MEPRPVQRLVGVNVADPDHPGLVQEERLQRDLSVVGDPGHDLGSELRGERLDSQPGIEIFLEGLFVGYEATSEPARVGEADLAAVIERESGLQVLLAGRGLVDAGVAGVRHAFGVDQQQVSGHAEVDDHGAAVVEFEHQVLAPAPDSGDLAALDGRLELRGCLRLREVGVEDLDRLDRAAGEVGFDLAPDRLDLGKFRHAPILSEGRRRLPAVQLMTARGCVL